MGKVIQFDDYRKSDVEDIIESVYGDLSIGELIAGPLLESHNGLMGLGPKEEESLNEYIERTLREI